MPDTVTAWPYYPDPRGANFSIIGFKFGMVPPNKFQAKTTGALGAFVDLNDGILLSVVTDDTFNTFYTSGGTGYQSLKVGTVAANPGPPPFSVTIDFVATKVGFPQHRGLVRLLFPIGIRDYTISVLPVGGGPNSIPNPVVLSPRNFSATA